MKIRWAVQTNLGGQYSEELKAACDELGHEFCSLKVIPFSDKLPELSHATPTIFYGATRWITNIHKSGQWNPGTFFNPASIFTLWAEKYGQHSLNYGATITTLDQLKEDIFAAKYGWDELLFIRPVSDKKEFAGEVIAAKSIYEWAGRIPTDEPDLGSVPILVSEPVGIAIEWRLFMVEGKVSTGSQYRTNHQLNEDPYVPPDVIKFAESRAQEYSPAPVFVMDIGKSGDQLYVIEIGCFNSSGFYKADVVKLIKDISEAI